MTFFNGEFAACRIALDVQKERDISHVCRPSSVFPDAHVAGKNGSQCFAPRAQRRVPVFSPQAKTLAQGEFISPEQLNP